MTRKTIIYAISTLMLCAGLVQFWRFFSPLFETPRSANLDLAHIISGVFTLSSGWNLLKLRSSGRELASWILFINLIGGALTLGFILPPNGMFSAQVKLLNNPIFSSINDHLFSIVFLVVFLLLNLSILIFLEQEKTKKLFTSDTVETLASTAD